MLTLHSSCRDDQRLARARPDRSAEPMSGACSAWLNRTSCGPTCLVVRGGRSARAILARLSAGSFCGATPHFRPRIANTDLRVSFVVYRDFEFRLLANHVGRWCCRKCRLCGQYISVKRIGPTMVKRNDTRSGICLCNQPVMFTEESHSNSRSKSVICSRSSCEFPGAKQASMQFRVFSCDIWSRVDLNCILRDHEAGRNERRS